MAKSRGGTWRGRGVRVGRAGLWAAVLLAIGQTAPAADKDGDAANDQPAVVSVTVFYDPNYPERATTRRLIELMAEEPNIRINRWGGSLVLPAMK